MIKFELIFPTSQHNIESIVTCTKSGEDFVRNLLMILDRINCEKDTEVYIDLDNKNKFLDDYKTLEHLLEIRIGWHNLEDVVNNFIYSNSIKIKKKEIEIDNSYLLIENFQIIDQIFKDKNSSRILNRNDFRHCENHHQYLRGKSPLIDGINGFNNATLYLSSAIGDDKTNRDIVINIDNINQDFIIRYENENFNNQFHAYHMVYNSGGKYSADERKIVLLRSRNKGIPRAFKLIEYRNVLLNPESADL